jgi:hypothetical protein
VFNHLSWKITKLDDVVNDLKFDNRHCHFDVDPLTEGSVARYLIPRHHIIAQGTTSVVSLGCYNPFLSHKGQGGQN